ncbi:hypothetical protein CIRG_10390 [Coccidioides immitis RMSCC 2394]|uniref:Acyl carrier protein n=1 Tax=Coccidioides immitis RMSCC 2394 TaxID=404692 RepID=A0A0J7AYN6_COCIT|nr:hypothetical protein CIRG_10390 [Coccidioides immitis RMSCC 2394]
MATTEEIRSDLAEIVNEVAGIDVADVQLDKSFVDDLDVDSLSMVEVVVAAEEKFGVSIPDEEVKNLKTVGDAWAQELPVRIAGRIAVEPSEVLERVKARRLDRSAQFAVVAAAEAWKDAGFEGTATEAGLDGERLGVAVATGIGGVTTLLDNYDTLLAKGPRRVSPLAVPMLMANASAANISLTYGARAAAQTPISACASGSEAGRPGRRPDPSGPGRRRARRWHRGRDPPAARSPRSPT